MKALLLAMALGQTHAGASTAPVQGPTTKITFGIETQYGHRNGPDGIVVDESLAASFASLIQLRSNFRREVLQSSSELK